MEKTMVELFAGVGGFRLGLEKRGWNTVWANQWEPSTKPQHAYEIYRVNFGKNARISNEDIQEVDKASIADHTLLVGGFPCQDYSVARTKARGIQGKKGVLWWSIWDTLEAKRPPFVLLENVDRLLRSPADQRGRDFGVMLRSIADLGYSMEWRVINAADYGFAQRRRRVFLFGAHESTKYHQKLKRQELKDIIRETGIFPRAFPVESMSEEDAASGDDLMKDSYSDLVKVSDHFEHHFRNAGVMVGGRFTTIRVHPDGEEPVKLRDVLEEGAPERLYIDEESDRYKRLERAKGAKKEPRVAQNGYQYMYSEGGMNFPDRLDRPARTILTSETAINRSTHLIKDPWTGRYRLLSPVECERLNGFPDDWTAPENCRIEIPFKRRYFLMGNALVVGVVERIGRALDAVLDM